VDGKRNEGSIYVIFDARNRTVATTLSCPRRAPAHTHARATRWPWLWPYDILLFLLVSPLPPLPYRNRARGVFIARDVAGARGRERFAAAATEMARRASERETRDDGGSGMTEDERTGGREKERGRVSRACLT